MSAKLVTVKSWYMPRRVYGRIVGREGDSVFVLGQFGLGAFHKSVVRKVRGRRKADHEQDD